MPTPSITDWIQAISGFFAIPLLFTTVIVAFMAWWQARKQAEAAENTAYMQIQQLAQSALAEDRSTRPLLRITWPKSSSALSDFNEIDINNEGLGPALNIRINYLAKPDLVVFSQDTALGAGKVLRISVEESYMGGYGLQIRYRSAHGREHETQCSLQDGYLEYKQFHLDYPHPMDQAWNIRFRDN